MPHTWQDVWFWDQWSYSNHTISTCWCRGSPGSSLFTGKRKLGAWWTGAAPGQGLTISWLPVLAPEPYQSLELDLVWHHGWEQQSNDWVLAPGLHWGQSQILTKELASGIGICSDSRMKRHIEDPISNFPGSSLLRWEWGGGQILLFTCKFTNIM